MEADLKSLQEKLTKLIALCSTLREDNIRLRSDLTQAQDNTDVLKTNMLQASNKLEILLESLPDGAESVGLES